jgi:hypothetical protein
VSRPREKPLRPKAGHKLRSTSGWADFLTIL